MKCFCASTRRVARLLTRHYEDELRPTGITPTQFELLATLKAMPEVSQAELAKALSVDQTTLSRNLALLITRTWIERGPSAGDSRKSTYRLSTAGLAGLQRALPAWKRAQKRIEEALGAEDTSFVWSTLDLLNQSLSGLKPSGTESAKSSGAA